jgi:UDP-3-O-[3-hydroxymyristoyl] glucosamine N-acyltransferase
MSRQAHHPQTAHTTVAVLATMLEAFIEPNANTEHIITGVATIEEAQEGDLTFVANPKYGKFLANTAASAVLVSRQSWLSLHSSNALGQYRPVLLGVENPQQALVQVVRLLYPNDGVQYPPQCGFRHHTAVVHESAQVDASVYLGSHVSIGAGCVLHDGVVLHAGTVLYENVHIGAHSTLHANVVCYHGTVIGERCIIHAGTVLGADGFGFVERADKSFEKIPQVGNVIVGNDVEIGANCTIDRATLGSTRIEEGVKLDNLIHVAHNVVLGEHSAIAAQTGISGSTTLGKRNRIAGQVGFVGHIATADDVVVFAQSGVSKSLTSKGVYFGYPAQAHADELKQQAALRQLPAVLTELRTLKEELESLKRQHAQREE